MRLFIAIPTEGAFNGALRGMQNELRRRGAEGNYTRPENLHLTLAFIGEYPDPDAVADALAPLRFAPFRLRLGGLGAFGELWWAGLEGDGELFKLAARVRGALAHKGIPFDRKRFQPHITLIRRARCRGEARLGALKLPEAETEVARFCLMRSERGKNGMIYTELASFPAETETCSEVEI